MIADPSSILYLRVVSLSLVLSCFSAFGRYPSYSVQRRSRVSHPFPEVRNASIVFPSPTVPSSKPKTSSISSVVDLSDLLVAILGPSGLHREPRRNARDPIVNRASRSTRKAKEEGRDSASKRSSSPPRIFSVSDASHCVVMCCHSYFIEKLISPFSKHAPISVCETQSLNNSS